MSANPGTEGNAALQTLQDQSRLAIAELQSNPGQARCQAHGSMARATSLLLQWQIAQIQEIRGQRHRHAVIMTVAIAAAVASGILAGVLSGNAGAIVALLSGLRG